MGFVEFMLAKAAVVVVLAFAWGVYCGLTGRSLGRAPRGRPLE